MLYIILHHFRLREFGITHHLSLSRWSIVVYGSERVIRLCYIHSLYVYVLESKVCSREFLIKRIKVERDSKYSQEESLGEIRKRVDLAVGGWMDIYLVLWLNETGLFVYRSQPCTKGKQIDVLTSARKRKEKLERSCRSGESF